MIEFLNFVKSWGGLEWFYFISFLLVVISIYSLFSEIKKIDPNKKL